LIAVDALLLRCGEPAQVPLAREMWRKSPSKGGKRELKETAGCLPIERMAGKGRKSLIIDIRESEKAKGRKVGREAITMERLK
jgi:hypothetical protein